MKTNMLNKFTTQQIMKIKKNFFDVFLFIMIIIVIALLFNSMFIEFQLKYAQSNNENIISKFETLNREIPKIAYQFANDSKIVNGVLKNESSMNTTYFVKQIKQNYSINSIYFYNEADKTVLNEELNILTSELSNVDKAIRTIVSRYEKNMENYFIYKDKIFLNGTVSYVYHDYRNFYIILNLNQDFLSDYISMADYPIPYGSYVYYNENYFYSFDKDFKYEQPQTFLQNNHKKKWNAIYTYTNGKNFQCITVLKLSDVIASALQTNTILYLIFVFAVLLILLAVFYFNRKKILEKFNKEITTLSKQSEGFLYDIAMRKLFMGIALNNSEKESILCCYNNIENKTIRGLILSIDAFDVISYKDDFYANYSFKFGIINVFEEILSENYSAKCLNISESSIAVFLLDDGVCDNDLKIKEKLECFSEKIKNIYEVTVSVAVSPAFKKMSTLIEYIPKLIELDNCKFIKGYQAILCEKDINNEPKNSDYPINLEKCIEESLKNGNMTLYRSYMDSFYEYLVCAQPSLFKKWCIRLFLAIIVSNEYYKNITVNDKAIEDIVECDRLVQIIEIFKHSIELKNTDNPEMETEINKDVEFMNSIYEYIDKYYCDVDFCASFLAERFELSTQYFNRRFNKLFKTPFRNYLLCYRLNIAKSLLKTTNFTIANIAEQCGFGSETYFVTLFKKNFDITSNEYRNSQDKN